MSTALRDSSIDEHGAEATPVESEARLQRHPWRHFARHYLEMAAVMGIGMFAAAFVLMVILNLAVRGDVTWERALLDYPAQALVGVAIGMSVPMIPWMRHRGHSRRSAYEMALVMAIPVIPFLCLALFDVVKGAQCGLYCGIGFVAMLALMIYRRDQYGVEAPPSDHG
jgi:cytochrome bd-type quinol oxidase subunit 2